MLPSSHLWLCRQMQTLRNWEGQVWLSYTKSTKHGAFQRWGPPLFLPECLLEGRFHTAIPQRRREFLEPTQSDLSPLASKVRPCDETAVWIIRNLNNEPTISSSHNFSIKLFKQLLIFQLLPHSFSCKSTHPASRTSWKHFFV